MNPELKVLDAPMNAYCKIGQITVYCHPYGRRDIHSLDDWNAMLVASASAGETPIPDQRFVYLHPDCIRDLSQEILTSAAVILGEGEAAERVFQCDT